LIDQFSYARIFVLPSLRGGLPIELLEAMICCLPILVSDIPDNKEVGLPAERYFRCGDVDDLRDKMARLLDRGLTEIEKQDMRKVMAEPYPFPLKAVLGNVSRGSFTQFGPRFTHR